MRVIYIANEDAHYEFNAFFYKYKSFELMKGFYRW